MQSFGFDIRKELQKKIQEFNQQMVQQGKPIEASMDGNRITIKYKDVTKLFTSTLQQLGMKVEIIITDNAIMFKIDVEEIKKQIAEKAGLDINMLRNAVFQPNDHNDYDFVSELVLSIT